MGHGAEEARAVPSSSGDLQTPPLLPGLFSDDCILYFSVDDFFFFTTSPPPKRPKLPGDFFFFFSKCILTRLAAPMDSALVPAHPAGTRKPPHVVGCNLQPQP